MRRIKLTQGKYATVDDEDYDYLMSFGSWYFDCGYATRNYTRPDKSQRKVQMHRVVAERHGMEIEGVEVDHVNQRPCDNRSHNLRPANREQNERNSGPRKNNKSGYKGVAWHTRLGKWSASIAWGGKKIHLGYYTNKREAARAYDAAAYARDPVYAYLNFPEKT